MIWWNIYWDLASVAALLIITLPLLWGFIFLYRYRQEKLAAFADQLIIARVVENRLPTAFWTKTGLYCMVWLCAVVALMQPKGNERYVSSVQDGNIAGNQSAVHKAILRKKMHEVIFLLDVSASMNIPDARGGKTREVVAKEIADNVISNLRGESVSFFAFTSATMQIVPSTMDYLFTRLMLRQVGINEAETTGTHIKQALETIRNQFFSLANSTTKTIILLTDGGDTYLEGAAPDKRKELIEEIIKPLADAEEKHVRVLVVGIGSQEGKKVPGITFNGHPVISALEVPLLRRLSIAGRGELIEANEMTPFQVSQLLSKAIARDETFVDSSIETSIPDTAGDMRIYDFYFQIPLGIAIFALAGCLLIPDTRKNLSSLPKGV